MAIRYCPSCGRICGELDKFCASCGKSFQATVPIDEQLTGPMLAINTESRSWLRTMMLRKGVDVETLRRIGGWTDYEMLKQYVHLDAEDLKRTQDQFSVLDNL